MRVYRPRVRRNVLGAAELILPRCGPSGGPGPSAVAPSTFPPLAFAGIVSAAEICATGRASSYAKRPRRVAGPLVPGRLLKSPVQLGHHRVEAVA